MNKKILLVSLIVILLMVGIFPFINFEHEYFAGVTGLDTVAFTEMTWKITTSKPKRPGGGGGSSARGVSADCSTNCWRCITPAGVLREECDEETLIDLECKPIEQIDYFCEWDVVVRESCCAEPFWHTKSYRTRDNPCRCFETGRQSLEEPKYFEREESDQSSSIIPEPPEQELLPPPPMPQMPSFVTIRVAGSEIDITPFILGFMFIVLLFALIWFILRTKEKSGRHKAAKKTKRHKGKSRR